MSDVPLAGAKFTLTKWKDGQNGASGDYYPYTPTKVGDQDAGTYSAVVTTGNDGIAAFPNVEPGEYKISETQVPPGYVKLVMNDIYINVNYDATTGLHMITRYDKPCNDDTRKSIDEATNTLGVTFEQAVAANEDTGTPAKEATFTVGNEPGVALPNTGGPGTSLFYIVGSILTLVAAVLLITKKRSDGAGI